MLSVKAREEAETIFIVFGMTNPSLTCFASESLTTRPQVILILKIKDHSKNVIMKIKIVSFIEDDLEDQDHAT